MVPFFGEVIGSGTSEDLAGEEVPRLMVGGAEVAGLEKEIAAVPA